MLLSKTKASTDGASNPIRHQGITGKLYCIHTFIQRFWQCTLIRSASSDRSGQRELAVKVEVRVSTEKIKKFKLVYCSAYANKWIRECKDGWIGGYVGKPITVGFIPYVSLVLHTLMLQWLIMQRL